MRKYVQISCLYDRKYAPVNEMRYFESNSIIRHIFRWQLAWNHTHRSVFD